METQNSFQKSVLAWMSRIEARLIAAEQQKTVVAPLTPEPSDTCNFVQALKFLSDRGYTISKSSLYKLTAANEVPHKHFRGKLVFSRKELLAWVEARTVEKNVGRDAALALAKSANHKGRGGRRV